MTIDGISLAAAVLELRSLYNAKIEKIYQPTRDEVVLHLHSTEGKKKLLLSASGSDCRIHLTDVPKANPLRAPNFCMVLRKYLTGGRIVDFQQFGLDRIVHIQIEAKDELGIPLLYTLAVEMMGKYSNIILIGAEGKILDSLRHVSVDTSSKRQVLPGGKYLLPPSDKLNPLTEDVQKLAAALGGIDLPHGILRLVQGISPATAEELSLRFFGQNSPKLLVKEQAEYFATSLKNFAEKAIYAPKPCFQTNMKGFPVFFSALPYAMYSTEGRISFNTVNLMLDSFYTIRSNISMLESMRENLLKEIKKNIVRIEKKLKIQWETLQASEDAPKLFLYGELVSSNIYRLKRGMQSAELFNYYINKNVSVPLDVALSPAQNAAHYFKRANKIKNGALFAKTRAAEYTEELDFLFALEYDALSSADMESLLEVKAELVKYGYLPSVAKDKPIRKDPLDAPRRFITSGGLLILAGRNSRQNDALTMRVASETDYWFHAKDMPGSHVILFTKEASPSDQDIYEAASVAATLSKGKDAGKVEVIYTKRASVWKQNGARPGMVLYKNQRSIVAAPSKTLLEKMEKQVTE